MDLLEGLRASCPVVNSHDEHSATRRREANSTGPALRLPRSARWLRARGPRRSCTTDVTTDHQHKYRRVPHGNALQQVTREHEEVARRRSDDARRRTGPGSPTRDQRQQSRRSGRAPERTRRTSPVRTTAPKARWGHPNPDVHRGRSSTPPNVPPNASSQSAGRVVTARAGRRTR